MKTRREKAKGRDNPPPPLGSHTDPSDTKTEKREGEVLNQVKTEMSSSKFIGEKRRNLQTKKILKKLRKVEKLAAKVVADMRAETSSLRKEMDNIDAAAEEKKKVVKLEKKKRNRRLTENLLMSITEHQLMEILFPPSGNY